jgi:DNA-binding XRE family transcriptional regulator
MTLEVHISSDIVLVMPDISTLGKRLRAAREARGMTQAEAARSIGVPRISVARWETNAHTPRQALVIRAVEAWIAATKGKNGGRRG